MTFEESLPIIFKHEGGEVNDPDDPGGHTKYGIIQETYHNWLRKNGRSLQSVSKITRAEAASIYRTNYWNEARCEIVPVGVNLILFDHAVNAGTGRARRLLQSVLGVVPDGIFGPRTQKALAEVDLKKLVQDFSQARRDFYYERVRLKPVKKKFLRSWLHRVRDCEIRALRAIDSHFGPSKLHRSSDVSGVARDTSGQVLEALPDTECSEQDKIQD